MVTYWSGTLLARIHLRLEFLVVRYLHEWFPPLNNISFNNSNYEALLGIQIWEESSRPSHLYTNQLFVWKSEPLFCKGVLFGIGL